MDQRNTPGDARYSTTNTNLAACIGALKIPIKTNEPITIVRDHDTGSKCVSFWFEDIGAEEFCGKLHEPRVLEKYWKNRATFEASNPSHPLTYMRAALDKRDWLNKAWHGRIMPAASLDKAGFTTNDIILASVIMASGNHLIRLEKPNYVFRKIPRQLFEDFNNFEVIGFIERPAALMRRALEARKLLIKLAMHPKNETKLKFTDGQIDQEGGRMAFISEKCSDEQIGKTLDALYKP